MRASIDRGGVARIDQFFPAGRNGEGELAREVEEDFFGFVGKRNGDAQLVAGAEIVGGGKNEG